MSVKPFKVGMYIFCKNHGVGLIKNTISLDVMGQTIECFEVLFEKDGITLNVPSNKMGAVGIRHLVPKKITAEVLEVLKRQSRGVKAIWSKRSRECEQKLFSGDLFLIAEVVRDLFGNTTNPGRSYTERVIYEKALYRVSAEIAIVTFCDIKEVETDIVHILSAYQDVYDSGIGHGELQSTEIVPLDDMEEAA